MNELVLYDKYGVALFTIALDESSTHDWSLMGENKLSISFEREKCAVLTPGCYVEFDGMRYYLLDEYKPRMINSVTWKYDVAFLDAASWMSVVLAMNTIDGKKLPIFNYTGPAREHAEIIVANLNRYMGTTEWKVGTVIDTPNIHIEYRGKYCAQILQEIVDGEDTEWWVDGMTLNIGRAEFGDAVELGYRKGLLGDISREQAADKRAYAYLVPIGSTRNIDPTKYGYERLQLPNGQVFVDINPDGVGELIEERAFAEIYPRYEGTVQYVRSMPATGNDGNEFTIYYIGDILPFNPNDYEIAGLVKRITFQSGELMGQTFEVNYNESAQEFEIITQFPEGGAQLPGGILTPAAGDKYVIWNITMPDEYYALASQEFLEAAIAFAESSIQDSSVYKGSLDYIDIQERGIFVRPGRRVRLLSDEYFSKGYYDSRITRMTRRLWYPNEVSIDVSAARIMGSIVRLQKSITQAETQIAQLSGQMPAIIKSGEKTSPSDSSVYTSAKSEKEFLSKTNGGRVLAPVSFEKGIAGGDDLFIYNAEKRCWIFTGNLLVEKGIAWNSSIDGFDPKTITESLDLDSSTLKINEFGQLTVIGGAGGGGSIASPLTWSGYSQGIWDGSAPANIEIPSLVSQLENDVEFITSDSVNSLLTDYVQKSGLPVYSLRASSSVGKVYLQKDGVDVANATLVLPTKLSQFTDDIVNGNYLPITGGTVNGNITANSLSVYGTTLLSYTAGDFPFKDVLNFTWSENTGDGIKLSVPGYHAEDMFLHLTVGGGAAFSHMVTASKFIGALQGNADSATLWSYNSPWVQDFNALNYSNNGLYHFDGDYLNLIGGPPHNSWNYSVLNVGSGSGRRQQVAIPYSSSRMFLRVNVDDNWSGWREFAFLDSTMYPTGDIAIQFPAGEYIDRWGNIVLPSTAGQWSVMKGSDVLMKIGVDGKMTASDSFNVGKTNGVLFSIVADWQNWQNVDIISKLWDDSRWDYVKITTPTTYSSNSSINICARGYVEVIGDFLTTGEITQHSSLELKDVVDTRFLTLKELAELKPYSFYWKDKRDDKLHAGAVADYVMPILPEVISTDKDNIHSMNYANAAWVVSTSLTPYVNNLVEEMKRLKAKVKYLEGKLKES